MKDWHVHTWYSHDSFNPPRLMLRLYEKHGFDEILVCDHNTLQGGRVLSKMSERINIITGMEYKTRIGDLIGADIEEEVFEKDPLAFIDAVHEQGGFVILPHPYRSHVLLAEVLERVDYIEAFNGHVKFSLNLRALDLARAFKKPWTAGSDAHFPWDIGTVGFDERRLIFRRFR